MAHFTSAMLFPPVHGGCYIISSVGNIWIGGVGGWVELYPNYFWIFEFF